MNVTNRAAPPGRRNHWDLGVLIGIGLAFGLVFGAAGGVILGSALSSRRKR